MAQSPEVFAACDARSPGAHTAEIQEAYSPEEKDLSQLAVHAVCESSAPSCTRLPQYEATFCEAAELMPTDQLVPEVDHHWAPACWLSPENRPASVVTVSPM